MKKKKDNEGDDEDEEGDEERRNAKSKDEGGKHFRVLGQAQERQQASTFRLNTAASDGSEADQLARGRARYASTPPATGGKN